MDKMTVNITGEQKELTILEGAAQTPFRYGGFTYHVETTDSFVKLIKAKATKENAVVAYQKDGMHAILDDTITDRPKDKLVYYFQLSQQAKEWLDFINGSKGPIGQKSFLNFLKRRGVEELSNLEELLFSVQNFRYVTNISGEASYEDGSNYVFGIKVKDAEGTTTLPKSIYPKIQIYKESEFVAAIEIEIEIVKPRDAGEGLGFVLSCPKFERYVEEAQAHEVEKMKKELDGFLVVAAWLFGGE